MRKQCSSDTCETNNVAVSAVVNLMTNLFWNLMKIEKKNEKGTMK